MWHSLLINLLTRLFAYHLESLYVSESKRNFFIMTYIVAGFCRMHVKCPTVLIFLSHRNLSTSQMLLTEHGLVVCFLKSDRDHS